MLTNGVTRRLLLPHEPGEWIDVAILSYQQVEDAKMAMVVESVRRMELLPQGALDLMAQRTPAATDAIPDPLAQYHIPTLLEHGVVAWSYDVPVSPEMVKALDHHTAVFVARALVLEPTEDDRKNDSLRFTVPLTGNVKRRSPGLGS